MPSHPPHDLRVATLAIAENKYAPGDPSALWGSFADPQAVRPYHVADLETILGIQFGTDAHFVTYVIAHPSGAMMRRQPRLNKDHLAAIREAGFAVYHNVFCADVDLPDHRAVTDADIDHLHTAIGGSGLWWYPTAHGARILCDLDHPVTPETYEARLPNWLAELQTTLGVGWIVDANCVDWTRHFRAPHVVRDGIPTNVTAWQPYGRDMRFRRVRDFFPRRKPQPTPAISTVITADIQLQISRHIRDYPQAVSGRGGHALTLKLACDLGRGFGLPDHVVLKILERWNTRNTPPWSPKDLERFLISARKRPDIQEGYLIRAPLDSALVEEVL